MYIFTHVQYADSIYANVDTCKRARPCVRFVEKSASDLETKKTPKIRYAIDNFLLFLRLPSFKCISYTKFIKTKIKTVDDNFENNTLHVCLSETWLNRTRKSSSYFSRAKTGIPNRSG